VQDEHLIVVAAEDNLLKGAAAQACSVQIFVSASLKRSLLFKV
jgi:N-acetyl-gamma-glutamylphosphate reductase